MTKSDGERERERERLVTYWLPSKEMGAAMQVRILDTAICISHSANTLERYKSSNYVKIAGQLGIFNLGMAISLGEETF